MKLYYSDDYVGSAYAFDTTRKAKWVADSLREKPIDGVTFETPALLEREHFLDVHGAAYVTAVETGEPRSLAESQGFSWDAGLWRMARAANGGLVAAALAAIEDGVAGTLSSGFHHARGESGAGFCTFNGLAIAAQAALSAGAENVLILDFDAHCGGGTDSLIRDNARIWHADVSVNGYDSHSGSARSTLRIVKKHDEYLPTIRESLRHLDANAPAFDLCLYNAGMDPHEHCLTGGMTGITSGVLAQRERVVLEWSRKRQIPLAFTLAGGYVSRELDQASLVALHRLTVAAFAGEPESHRT